MAALNETEDSWRNILTQMVLFNATIIIFEKEFENIFLNMYIRILFRNKLNCCTENIEQKKNKSNVAKIY